MLEINIHMQCIFKYHQILSYIQQCATIFGIVKKIIKE